MVSMSFTQLLINIEPRRKHLLKLNQNVKRNNMNTTTIPLTYDKKALIDFMEAECIHVPILMTPFKHKVIHAEKVLIKINELCNITKEEFQTYINGYNKMVSGRDEFVDKCIKNIEYAGVFKVHGWEEVGNKPYIFLHKVITK